MSKDSKLAQILKKPLIRSSDAREVGIHPASLAYYEKKGELERINRGLYLNKKVPMDIEVEWENLVFSVYSIPKGVVTGVSALALYGLTEEIPRQHWIAVPNKTSAPARANTRIIRLRNYKNGISSLKMGNIEIPIYELERILVDAFRLLSKEAAIKALKAAFGPDRKQKPDLRKVFTYGKVLHVDMEPFIQMVVT